MGTYTTNHNLFLPTIGEQGWGELVNGNFETIDTFLKPISLSGTTYTFTGNQTGGSISATSVTNSGTLTSTGKITANGGISTKALSATTGTFSGAVTGSSFNEVPIKRSITVTPTNATNIPAWDSVENMDVLPCIIGVVYNGTVRVRKMGTINVLDIRYTTNGYTYVSASFSDTLDITLNNAQCLRVYSYRGYLGVDGISLS